MAGKVSALWQCTAQDMKKALARSLEKARDYPGPVHVFFRADDIAYPSRAFFRLLQVFSANKSPLCLAVVPAWITHARWEALQAAGRRNASLWCWHQHGWRHVNHEAQGKKQEFGPSRAREAVRADIASGKKRLESILGRDFHPVFTPPWNRCGAHALEALEDLGFKAVSRSKGAFPPSLDLPDLFVNVDLHTRKEPGPRACMESFFTELDQALATGACGFMIHHQRMNETAFFFLEALLSAIRTEKKLDVNSFEAFY